MTCRRPAPLRPCHTRTPERGWLIVWARECRTRIRRLPRPPRLRARHHQTWRTYRIRTGLRAGFQSAARHTNFVPLAGNPSCQSQKRRRWESDEARTRQALASSSSSTSGSNGGGTSQWCHVRLLQQPTVGSRRKSRPRIAFQSGRSTSRTLNLTLPARAGVPGARRSSARSRATNSPNGLVR